MFFANLSGRQTWSFTRGKFKLCGCW